MAHCPFSTSQALIVLYAVNNVGKGHAMPTYLVDMPQEEMTDVVAVNVNSTVQVTHAVLPGMVQKYVDSLSCAGDANESEQKTRADSEYWIIRRGHSLTNVGPVLCHQGVHGDVHERAGRGSAPA